MEACNFPESNKLMGPPEGMTEDQCRTIFAYSGEMEDGNSVVITCFKPTKKELEDLQNGGRLWMIVLGNTMSPVKLTTVRPFLP